jgi:hypothetical protein
VTRIRSLKPEIPDDAKLATVSRDARLTFVYLITQADNYGYVMAPPRKILGLLYPHDPDVTIPVLAGWLTELASLDVIRLRETRDGTPVIELANWTKHQKLDKRGKDVIGAQLSDAVLTAFPFRSDTVLTPLPPDLGIKGSREQGTEGSREEGADETAATTSRLPGEYSADYAAAIRSSHRPEMLRLEIGTLARGKNPQAEGATPEDVGRGLRELLLNGASMGKLANYVRIAQLKRLKGPIADRPDDRNESYADLARRLEAVL